MSTTTTATPVRQMPSCWMLATHHINPEAEPMVRGIRFDAAPGDELVDMDDPDVHTPLMAIFDQWLGDDDLDRRAQALSVETDKAGNLIAIEIGGCREGGTCSARIPVTMPDTIREALAHPGTQRLVMHDAVPQIRALEVAGFATIAEMLPRVIDTEIACRLLDPTRSHTARQAYERWVGVVEPSHVQDETHEDGWVETAGIDAVRRYLMPMLKEAGMTRLFQLEHEVAQACALMETRGVLTDAIWLPGLIERLEEERAVHVATARAWGVENINRDSEVVSVLTAMGETLTATTKTGKTSTAGEALLPLADLAPRTLERLGAREPNPVAEAVVRARITSQSINLAKALADGADAGGRVHARIKPQAARTARMSISEPALQQLPSHDWEVRRAIIADPGHVIVAADFSQIEMRVLAALSRDEGLLKAIESGEDIHSFVASRVFGEGFTKAQRSLAKQIGFAKIYGAGAATMAAQSGAPVETIEKAVAAFDTAFPGVEGFIQRMQAEARETGQVLTPSGRRLPVDPQRIYSATNYTVQSTARDLFAEALLDLIDAGLGGSLLLPVHDEIVAQAPADQAETVARRIAEVMSRTFMGVDCPAEPSVYGTSWGHGYMPTEMREAEGLPASPDLD